ncbi:hypothetical protein [Micromonospora sp. NBC_01796]|nr:hypothetical protein [Micromonospora sp. NBC_01796]WSA83151.1 hypothetical protein OIE47_22340 [Micromonospora sp. NBC_01796]
MGATRPAWSPPLSAVGAARPDRAVRHPVRIFPRNFLLRRRPGRVS